MFQVKIKKPYGIVYEEGDEPVPKKGEALIAVKANGICGSDMHRYTGHLQIANPDNIIGHEYGGIIKKIEHLFRTKKNKKVVASEDKSSYL